MRPAPHALPRQLTGARYLVLDGLQDPGNVGTLWRTADAFGADGLILLPGCADPWEPQDLALHHGACFRLPLWEGTLEEPDPPPGPSGPAFVRHRPAGGHGRPAGRWT